MKLDSIGFRNFCSFKDRRFYLKRINIISGPNGSGKTGILQGIELLLNGSIYDPVTGKNADLLGFFGPHDEVFEVIGEFHDGTVITRKFTRKESRGKMAVSQEIDVTPLPAEFSQNPGVTALEDWLRKKTGNILLFDYQKFFLDSPAKQFEQLFRAFGDSDMNSDTLKEKLLPDEVVPESLWDQIINSSLTGIQLINDTYQNIDRYFKEQNQFLQQYKKTVRSLNEIRQDQENLSASIYELQAQYKDVMSQVEKLTIDINKIENAKMLLATRQQQKESLEKDIADMKKKLEELENPIMPDTKSHEEKIDELMRQRKSLSIEIEKLSEAIKNLKQQHQSKSNQLKNAFREAGENDALVSMQKILIESGICPVCGNTPEKESLQEIVDKLEAQTFSVSTVEIQKELEELTWKVSELEDAKMKLEKHLSQYNVEIEKTKHLLESAKLHIVNISNLKQQITKRENELTACLASIKEVKSNMPAGDAKAMKAQLMGLKERSEKLRADLDEANSQRGILIAQEEAFQRYVDAQANLEIAKQLKTKIQELKADIVESIFMPIEEDTAKKFHALNGDDKWEVEFRFQDERGNDIFQMGLVPVKKTSPILDEFIPFHRINHGHRVKLLFAFLMSLPNKGLKLYMLDDMEKLSEGYDKAFIEGCLQLKENIDNILITSAHQFIIPIEGGNLISYIRLG